MVSVFDFHLEECSERESIKVTISLHFGFCCFCWSFFSIAVWKKSPSENKKNYHSNSNQNKINNRRIEIINRVYLECSPVRAHSNILLCDFNSLVKRLMVYWSHAHTHWNTCEWVSSYGSYHLTYAYIVFQTDCCEWINDRRSDRFEGAGDTEKIHIIVCYYYMYTFKVKDITSIAAEPQQ